MTAPSPPVTVQAIRTLRWEAQPAVVWVEVTDSEGRRGTGETFYNPRAVEAVVHDMAAPLLLGREVSAERAWRELFACANFYGYAGAEMRAFSAIDIALWDLTGQLAGLSISRLMGGRVRDAIRVYNTCVTAGGHDDADAFLERPAELARELLDSGVRAMKVWPFDRYAPQIESSAVTGPAGWSAMGPPGSFIDPVQLREGVGILEEIHGATEGQMTIMLEGHSRWDLNAAIRICKAVEDLNLGWVEDIIQPDSAADLARLVAETRVPQAVSERLFTRFAFRDVFEARAAHVAMVDLVWTGGLTEGRKIATLADAFHLPLAPHDCTGPIALAASLQLCAHAPNAMIMETVRGFCDGWYRDVLDEALIPVHGEIAIPDRPGLGVKLRDGFESRPGVTLVESRA